MPTKVKPDELADVTPAYVNVVKRLDGVRARLDEHLCAEKSPLVISVLNSDDLEELAFVRKNFLDVERKMRRYQDQLNKVREFTARIHDGGEWPMDLVMRKLKELSET